MHRAALPPHQVGGNLFGNQKLELLPRKAGWHSCASRLRRWPQPLEEAGEGAVIVHTTFKEGIVHL